MDNLFEVIKSRRSYRSFDGAALSEADREKIMEYAKGIENPFGTDIEFRLLDAKEHGLTSPVLTGATLYVAAKTKKADYKTDLAYGYVFEDFVLYCQSLGIGTVWIAGTFNRGAFEKAMEVGEGEVMPCMTPVGYPAKKMSVKESMMRTGVKADSRKAAAELVFDGAFGAPLNPVNDAIANAIEMMRWAPSAVNKQPWRVIYKDGKYHFYEKRDKGYDNGKFDLQMIDVGIGLSHFVLALKDAGYDPQFEFADPGIEIPSNVKYAVSVIV